jgi:mercuric ion binding protein
MKLNHFQSISFFQHGSKISFWAGAICIFLFFPQSIHAQKKVETTFIVDGECNMCKERIEGALDAKGVLFSEWNVETKQLFVAYRPGKISIEEIHERINNVGHDTERSSAPDSIYENIHGCCRYRATPSPQMEGVIPPDTLSPIAPAHIRSHE